MNNSWRMKNFILEISAIERNVEFKGVDDLSHKLFPFKQNLFFTRLLFSKRYKKEESQLLWRKWIRNVKKAIWNKKVFHSICWRSEGKENKMSDLPLFEIWFVTQYVRHNQLTLAEKYIIIIGKNQRTGKHLQNTRIFRLKRKTWNFYSSK